MRKLILTICLLTLTVAFADKAFVISGKIVVDHVEPVIENAIPVDVMAFNEWNNFGGTLEQIWDGSGMNGYFFDGVYPLVPPSGRPLVWPTNLVSEWYTTYPPSFSYRDEWSGEAIELLTGYGWVISDLGESANLNEWHLWNIKSAGNMGVQTFNVYYANTPTVPPAHGPTQSNQVLEYDFASGGWTLLNTSGVLFMPQAMGNNSTPADLVVDMSGVKARYVGIEVITNHGSTTRIGLSEQGMSKTVYSKAVTQ